MYCVCALSHAWIPVRPCAREHARAVWTRACACLCVPGVLRPGDAHGSGVPASVSLCTGANAGPTVGPVGPAPARRLSPYVGCLRKKKVAIPSVQIFFFLFQKILESSIDMESPVPQTHLALPCGSFHRQDHI